MRFDKVAIINGVDVTTTSSAIDSSFHIACSLQAISTGTEAGTAKIQVSNDGINFTDLSGATVVVTGAGSFLMPKIDLCYTSVRVVFTKSGGSGTLEVWYKSIGF